MPSLSRDELENWVERWLQANRDAEKAGDWAPLADFYAEDATYGWNIGPKEDVMCIGSARSATSHWVWRWPVSRAGSTRTRR